MTKHFAEINTLGQVVKLTVVADEDVDNNGGDQSDTAVGYFLSQHRKTMESQNNTIVQSSETGAFRKRPAEINGSYDSVNDVFLKPKPYSSWTLNSDYEWEAPVAFPSVETKGVDSEGRAEMLIVEWDEDNTQWKGFDGQGNTYTWNTTTSEWD
tara:strand:- start:1734 stop:2195 length:462 start_codon:yes stop_codon:yes gene_type:complete